MSKLTFIVAPLKDSNQAHTLLYHAPHLMTWIGVLREKLKLYNFLLSFLINVSSTSQTPISAHAQFCLHPVTGCGPGFIPGTRLSPITRGSLIRLSAFLQSPGFSAAAWQGGEKVSHGREVTLPHDLSLQSNILVKWRLELSIGSTAQRLKSAIKEACFKQALIFSKSLGCNLLSWTPR